MHATAHESLAIFSDDESWDDMNFFEWLEESSSTSPLPSHASDDSGLKQANVKYVKRYRPNKKKYLKNDFPRIIKRDFRRLFPQMYANVFNSGNRDLIHSFCSTYIRPDSIISNDAYSAYGKPQYDGIGSVVDHIIIQQDLMPDFMLRVGGVKIKQFKLPNRRSELSFQIEVSGTKVYRYERSSLFNPSALPFQLDQYYSSTSTSLNNQSLSEIEFSLASDKIISSTVSVAGRFVSKSFLSKPIPFSITGLLVFAFDEHNAIDRFECFPC